MDESPRASPTPAAEPASCLKCGAPIAAEDRFCRRCGRSTARKGEIGWAYTPWGIAILTLTIMGPLAIGLVWRSPKLSRSGKWAMTVGISLFSILVLYFGYLAVLYALHQWRELNDEMKSSNF